MDAPQFVEPFAHGKTSKLFPVLSVSNKNIVKLFLQNKKNYEHLCTCFGMHVLVSLHFLGINT